MAADSTSPIAPARVRVLVLPAGRIKRRRFMTFVERLQHESTVRLGDISPDGRPDRAMFSPMAFPNGALLYHFSTAMPTPSNLALTPFELFREPMMVVGLADAEEYCHQNGELEEETWKEATKRELENVADTLREQHPKILVHQLLIMDCPTENNKGWVPDHAMCVPVQGSSRSITIKTVMCDVSAKFLSELTTYAKALQALPSVQSPGMSANPRANLDRSASLMGTRSDSPSDNLSRTISPSSADSRASTPPVKPPTSFDEIANAAMAGNNLTRSVSKTEKEGSRTTSRDRMSMQAFGSSNANERARNKGKARVGIVIGNLYMMSGRWSDAWRELVENTNKSRTASDYIWYAKGLESVLVCMLLFVWTGYDFHIPAICYTGIDRPSSIIGSNVIKDGLPSLGAQEPVAAKEAAQRLAKLLPDLIPNILGIHERATTLGGEVLPPVAYSESIVRMAKLLALIQNARGQLDSTMIGRMIGGRLSSYQPQPNTGYTTGISKHVIAEIVFRAYPPPSANVPLIDETKILSGIASVLSMLGLERKKAIVVKELVASLVPALVQARKVGAAEMGIHPAASLSAAFDIPASDQQSGLNGLLRDVYLAYGTRDTNQPKPINGDFHTKNDAPSVEALVDAAIGAATNFAGSQAFGSLSLKIDILRACIDFCEALPDLSGIVQFAALLLRTAGPQSAVVPGMAGGRVRLAIEEQIRLISNMSRTGNAAQKIGMHGIQVPYWDDFVLRDVQWSENDTAEKLREHHTSEIHVKAHSQKRSPFLYDPFAKKDKKTEEKVLVAKEPAELVVTLQNPYEFEVRIEKLSFATEGVALEVQHAPFALGPTRLQKIPVVVRANEIGKSTIVGCSIKFVGCIEQVFPVYSNAWAAEVPTKLKSQGLQLAADGAIETAVNTSKGQQNTRPVTGSLSSTVIQAQPHVVVDGTSLSESALMVLEGQRKTFQVTLHNTSSTKEVDFLHLSFEDSLSTSIRSALSHKELSRAEMYELENRLSQDPVFTWSRSDSTSSQTILTGEKATFDITIEGRPGLGAARVLFDYAYLGQPLSELQGRAYTRQVAVSVDITVNASVQLHRVDITEFPSDFAWSNQHRQRRNSKSERPASRQSSSRPVEKSNDRFRMLLDRVGRNSDNEEHCLVLLDLRNAWPSPLTVSIKVCDSLTGSRASSSSSGAGESKSEAGEGWKRAYTVHEVIHPGHIARLVLLLPKIHIANPHAPIPLLTQNQRQFVVSTDTVFSAEAEMVTREQFWFREELLKYIHGSWKEEGSARQGTVDLRGVRLSPRTVGMLRLQDVDVSLSVLSAAPGVSSAHDSAPGPAVMQLGRSSFQVSPESFLTLQTTIMNRSATPIRGLLRLQPTLAHQVSPDLALDIGRKLMISGLLQQRIPTIQPLQSVTVEVGICPVVAGAFDVNALVEELVIPSYESMESKKEIDGDDNELDEDFTDEGKGLKLKERRIWRAGETCKIIVCDAEN